jgi:3-phosphoshikimate 1-carboxyvinyltransferase
MGAVTVRAQALSGFQITAEQVPGLVDELPVLAVLATQAHGETVVAGAGELRVKECDRVAAMARELSRLGADIEERDDGWRIAGPTPLEVAKGDGGGDGDGDGGGASGAPAVVVTEGDHRIAMAMVVAALVTAGELVLDDEACIGISYPGFLADLEQITRG